VKKFKKRFVKLNNYKNGHIYHWKKRCDLIYTEYQIKISRCTLSKVYKDNNVGYLKTHKSFHSATKENELTI
jgi:hypothetical protein